MEQGERHLEGGKVHQASRPLRVGVAATLQNRRVVYGGERSEESDEGYCQDVRFAVRLRES